MAHKKLKKNSNTYSTSAKDSKSELGLPNSSSNNRYVKSTTSLRDRRIKTAIATLGAFGGMFASLLCCQFLANLNQDNNFQTDEALIIDTSAVLSNWSEQDSVSQDFEGCPIDIGVFENSQLIGSDSTSGLWSIAIDSDDYFEIAQILNDLMTASGWTTPTLSEDGAINIYTRQTPDSYGYSIAIISIYDTADVSTITMQFA